ncbi:MAG TPA: hypothetical protein VHL99_01855 [Candidatus Binatia bacterium]|nr:hypothetical protein [Candidatus Binatia bacterium]
MSATARRRLCFIVLLALAVAGCSLHEPARVIPIKNPPEFRPLGAHQVKTLPEALAAIVTVCTKDLELPPVEPLYVHLYKDIDSYTYYTGKFSATGENKPRLTLALPHENQLHISLATARGQVWGALLRVLAHEYGHNIEYVLSAGASVPRWISEGFAEWVSAKVMDGLGWESYASSVGRAERELSRYEYHPPRLSDLETASGWAGVSAQPKGRVGTYDLAFFAVDKLMEKKGVPAMMEYFASRDFAGVFGRSQEDFERALAGELDRIYNATARLPSSIQAGKPEWKTGYQWRYSLAAPGYKPAAVTNQVVREDVFDGTPVYVLSAGKNEYPHDQRSLSVLAILSGGKMVSKNDPPSLPLNWPLKVGLTWDNDYVAQDLEHKQNETIQTRILVADFETVRVPAGTFPAFRIETYASPGGELLSDQWYAPTVKWFVKSKFYREDGVVEQDLISFKAD